ncbi:hypothetical protein KTO58_04800 [Chitinophaga pendula]|uniref:hypothetical protein n=1 Tax=Chitinophaga TaxID=79328 RepID=UPI0012FDF96B|nr:MULTISPECIES: hypothetical protein [Chitinophaga]UCJ08512.1 hypothetical protein KTO58_04800 [Chitinophaga pendula]
MRKLIDQFGILSRIQLAKVSGGLGKRREPNCGAICRTQADCDPSPQPACVCLRPRQACYGPASL